MKAKGMAKGGLMPTKGAVSDKEFEKFKKTRGKAMGGTMKAKGMAKGGKMATKSYAKGGAAGGMRKPSNKNSGLYGR